MVKFEELKNNSVFNIGVWEMKTLFKDEEFTSKFVFNSYVQRLTFSFIKTSDNTCKELTTGTEFEYEKSLMINEETGLYFFGSYVNDNVSKRAANKQFTTNYFEIAKKLNNSNNKKLIRK